MEHDFHDNTDYKLKIESPHYSISTQNAHCAHIYTRGGSRIDLRGGAKHTARVSAREILCATPTFDVISAHDIYTKKK